MAPKLHLEKGSVWLNKKTASSWNLDKGKGDRSYTHEITFDNAFSTPPKVFAAFSALDVINDDDLRVSCMVTSVTATGFKFDVGTWGATHIWSCAVGWVAYDKDEAQAQGARIESGRIPLKKTNPGWKLDKGTGKRAHSHHAVFDKSFPVNQTPPIVLAGFCLLDVLVDDDDHHLKVSTKNANNFGFDVEVETWKKTKVWGVSVSYIAFEACIQTSTGARIETGVSEFVKTTPNMKALSTGDGERKVTKGIEFENDFADVPQVLTFLSMQDSLKGRDLRLKSTPRNVKESGLDIEVATWSDSRVFGCHVSWLAFTNGEVKYSGSSSSTTTTTTTSSSQVKTDASDDESEGEEKPTKKESKSKGKEKEKEKEKGKKDKDTDKEEKKKDKGEKRKETDDSDDDNLCKICMDAKVNTCLVPCGHLCLCQGCADEVKKHKEPCPICRGLIKQIVHTYS